MAARKIKGTTIYPPLTVKNRVQEIAENDDGATFNYWAVKLMKIGLARYEKRQQRRESRQGKLQPN